VDGERGEVDEVVDIEYGERARGVDGNEGAGEGEEVGGA